MPDIRPFKRASLRSWKEIANYFGVSVRTVQRWEKTQNLPVHRESGGQPVVYLDELESWRKNRNSESTKLQPGSAPDLTKPRQFRWIPFSTLLPIILCVLLIGALSYWYINGNVIDSTVPLTRWWEDSQFPAFQHEVKWRWSLAVFDRFSVEDVNQDGKPEVLINFFPSQNPIEPGKLQCYSSDQDLLWEFVYGRELTFEDRQFSPNYVGHFVRTVRDGPRDYILTVAVHHRWFPCQVALLDPSSGKLLEEYWHPGGISHILIEDLDKDGSDEVILGGINNPGTGLGHPSLVVLKIPFSRIEPRQDTPFSRFSGGTEYKYVLFPRIDTSWVDATLLLVTRLQFEADNRFTVHLRTNESDPGFLYYEFDRALRLEDFRVSDDVPAIHDRFSIQGFLDHRFSPEEEACLGQVQYFPTAPNGNSPEVAAFWKNCEMK